MCKMCNSPIANRLSQVVSGAGLGASGRGANYLTFLTGFDGYSTQRAPSAAYQDAVVYANGNPLLFVAK